MRNTITLLILAGVLIAIAGVPASAQATDPISVLKSDAPLQAKQDACRKLSIGGTVDAVPVLAPLLTDETLSHMARYALEPMPFPEAGAALRDALGKTQGRLKVGVVKSLAVRKDNEAIPSLIDLLGNSDTDVAGASARALGVIATPDAQKALEDALSQAPLRPGLRDALCDGLCSAADQRVQEKQQGEAVAIYDRLLHLENATPEILTAALRGMVLNQPADKGIPLVVERLLGDDDKAFAAALRVFRETANTHAEAIAALAGDMSKVAPGRKVHVLSVFRSGDGDVAGAAVLALANDDDPDVRVTALHAATRMGYAPALPVLAHLAVSDDNALAEIAKTSLAHFPGTDRYAAIDGMLGASDAKTRRVAVELIGDGALDHPVALLMKTAESDSDEGVRTAALEGLRDQAGADELPRLLDRLVNAPSPAEIHAAESTLAALCERQRGAAGDIVIQDAVYGDLPGGASASVLDQVSRMVKDGAHAVDATNGNFGDTAPGVPKKLRIDYTENGTPVSKTVKEGETLNLSSASVSTAVANALCDTFDHASGDAKLAALRLLGAAGGAKALDTVRAASSVAETKDTALRVVCNWQTADALPAILELAETSSESSIKEAALRGAVRLLNQSGDTPDKTAEHYAALLDHATTPEDKKLILSGLTQLPDVNALALAVAQMSDESVKAEAVQTAVAIAGNLGKSSRDETAFLVKLAGWQGDTAVWRMEDGALVGQTKEPSASDALLWSDNSYLSFYLAADIQIEPNAGSAGLLFRSAKAGAQASGYLVGIGQDAWGSLSREPGHVNLGGSDDAANAVKPGEWNHFEILAVGPAIWTAINGKLGTAYIEKDAGAALSGQVAILLRAGPPQSVRCRVQELVTDPAIKMGDLSANDLIGALPAVEK